MNVIDTKINGLYPIKLLPHRVEFHAARPTWEAERLAAMYEMVEPGQTIYDVGAEEGDFTALYRSWVGDQGTVVAIEPSTGYWPAIRATWEGNGFMVPPKCFPAFAADTTYVPPESEAWDYERRRIMAIQDDGWPYCSRWPVTPDFGFSMLNERQADVPGWRMDDVALELRNGPHHIVFDIEGAEWHAMTGCELLCRKESGCRPMLWVSVHEPHMAEAYDRRMGDIIRLVISWDYRYRYLGTHGGEDFWLFQPEESA